MNFQLAKKPPLTQDDREELNLSDIRTFLLHVNVALKEVYNSTMRLRKHFVLIDKQNCILEKKLTNYKKANKPYIIENKQLKSENKGLET